MRLVIFILIFFSAPILYAQELKWDEKLATILIDTFVNKKKITTPKKAVILSAIFPGAGQFYNRQYYKLAIVYGGIGALIYNIDFNQREFERFDLAYRNRLMGLSTAGIPDNIPIERLRSIREKSRKNKEVSYFGLGFVYLLNIADAFVSAHLTSFNIDDDLITGRVKFMEVQNINIDQSPFPAIGLTITF